VIKQTPPSDGSAYVLFTGVVKQSNVCNEQCMPCMKQIYGTFEYFLDSTGPNQTKWTRRVYFYTVAYNPCTWCAFCANSCLVWPTQKTGAYMFTQTTKKFLESDYYKENLYLNSAPDAAWSRSTSPGQTTTATSASSSGHEAGKDAGSS